MRRIGRCVVCRVCRVGARHVVAKARDAQFARDAVHAPPDAFADVVESDADVLDADPDEFEESFDAKPDIALFLSPACGHGDVRLARGI